MKTLPNKFFTAVLILFAFGIFAAANSSQWVSFTGGMEQDYEVTVLSSDNTGTVLQIDVPGMFVEDLRVNGRIFQELKFYHFGTTQEVGSPALPIAAEMVALPGTKNVKASVVSVETILLEGYNVIPFQEPTTDDKGAPEFSFNQEVYSKDAWYPEVMVTLGEIGIMRDLRVVPVRVVPFRYNPVSGQLEVATRVVVKLEYFGTSDKAVKTTTVSEVSPRTAGWYRSNVVNFDHLNLGTGGGTDEFQVKYLIICPDDAVSIIQPFADFRNAQGYGVEIRVMEPGFNTSIQFRDYIHDLYVSDGLEYVLMVGDWCTATGHQITPMHYWENTWSDSWYTMIDPWPNTGDDFLADLAIGRFVYDNDAELQLQMDKTMGYLLNPSTADNWAEHTLLVAHQEQYPQKYTLCKEQIRTFPYSIQTPIFGTAYGGAGATNQDVINYLNNEGSGILNYRGHGSQTEWWSWGPTGGFGAPEIAQLTNADKLFVHFDVCCDNMDFPGYNGNCFCETFMKHDYGCVAIHSAIIPSYTIPNHDYDKEFYKAIFNEGIVNIGYASNFANITVYNVHGSIGESNIRTYLWLGDSSIDPWTNTPQVLTVTHLPIINIGMSTLDVTVMMDGSPVEGAMVCGQNSETYTVDYTNTAGTVTLNFDAALTQPGFLTLTVTCHNGLPYQSDIQVIPPVGPYVVFNAVDINDAGAWMPNGQLDFGEDVLLSITVENVGVEEATDVNVTITTDDIYTTVIDGSENYGNIAAYATAMVPDGFEIAVAQDVPDMQTIPFTLTATSGASTWESSFNLTAHAPILEFERLVIDDPTGNNNHQLDPGETADFNVSIKNNGSTNALNIEVIISTTEPLVTIPNNSATITDLAAGAEAVAVYANIEADASMAAGTRVDFTLDMTADGGYENEDGFSIMVGDERYAPSGPDSYGYWAYDMYDGVGAPVYDWVEIAPSAGGPGINLNLGDDQTGHVNLPFTFRYYGSDFTQISICSNGWIAMGYTTSTDWSNSGIPNSDGPPNMIAPLWDDLNPAVGGQVCWYSDAANHRLIVEWYQVPYYSGGGSATIQTILFDPAYYPTLTGDGEIQVNYNNQSNISSCTVGIENSTETVGIQFLYDGNYDEHAMPLESGFAIKYTTLSSLGGDLTLTLEPQGAPIVIPANGGSFNYDITIENVGVSTAYFQAWIDVMLPNSTWRDLLLRSGLMLGQGASINRSMTQNVPGWTPAGTYEYWGHAGVYPSDPWAEDYFTFEKAAGDFEGESEYTNWSLSGWDEGEGLASALPTEFGLSQNYPNPFNPETSIDFALPEAVKVNLSVYNLLGQRVATLYEGMTPAGYYTIRWEASNLSSGVYFYHLQAGDFNSIKKCILMK